MINSVLNSGLQGVQRGMQGAHRNAHDIATFPVHEQKAMEAAKSGTPTFPDLQERPHPSMEESLVNLKLNEHQVKASAKVIKAADNMLGTLLDVLA